MGADARFGTCMGTLVHGGTDEARPGNRFSNHDLALALDTRPRRRMTHPPIDGSVICIFLGRTLVCLYHCVVRTHWLPRAS